MWLKLPLCAVPAYAYPCRLLLWSLTSGPEDSFGLLRLLELAQRLFAGQGSMHQLWVLLCVCCLWQ